MPTPKKPSDAGPAPLVAFGAHPDDVEFACGGVLAAEVRAGRPVQIVVCSSGESATRGTPVEREAEARKGAEILGATLEFLDLGGDAHFEWRVEHAIKIARLLRKTKPVIVLAPSVVRDQHPDHAVLGELVRQAARLARYGGVAELKDLPAHAIGQLLFYAISPSSEPSSGVGSGVGGGAGKVLYDVSGVIETWKQAMNAHGSQTAHLKYIELQLSRARTLGLCAGVEYAIPLFPSDSIVVESLASISRGARAF
ncbi:MAG: PIG-L family deacetylase [Phycisphaeraceae bacterium]|nr:PIG-L family deacetylase [Phycisphaeraceae bacterium]